MIVHAYSMRDGVRRAYIVPSIAESVAYSKKTWGKQHDTVERRAVEGGLPLLWWRAPAHDLPAE